VIRAPLPARREVGPRIGVDHPAAFDKACQVGSVKFALRQVSHSLTGGRFAFLPAFNFQLSTVNLFPARTSPPKEKGAAPAAPLLRSISFFS